MDDGDVKRLIDAIATSQAETREHVDAAVNTLRQDTTNAIDAFRQDTTRAIDALRQDTTRAERAERTAAETQAKFKFSFVELYRRMTSLEESVADLQARVERLESSTH